METTSRAQLPKRWQQTEESTFNRLCKLDIPRHEAKWKARAIDRYKEGQNLSDGHMYRLFVEVGMHPIDAFVQEACFWVEYYKTIGPSVPSMSPDEQEALHKRLKGIKFPILGA